MTGFSYLKKGWLFFLLLVLLADLVLYYGTSWFSVVRFPFVSLLVLTGGWMVSGFLVDRAFGAGSRSFVALVTGASVIRLVLYLLYIVALVLTMGVGIVPDVVSFGVHYLLFTLFELTGVIRRGK